MIDERLNEEHIQSPSDPVQLPPMTEEQLRQLVDWAKACLGEMQNQSVANLSALTLIPVPSQFIKSNFPLEEESLDVISGGFSNCPSDLSVKLFAKAFALAGIDNYQSLLLAYRVLPHSHCAWEGFDEGLEELFSCEQEKVQTTFSELALAYADDPALIGIRDDELDYYLREVEEFRRSASIQMIWSYGRAFDYVHCHYHGVGLFSSALRLNIDFGIELLETVCLPPVCEMVLTHYDILHDRQVMFEILHKAPSFAAATERSQVSGIVAPFVLGYYLLHVTGIADSLRRRGYSSPANPELEAFRTDEAPQLFKEAVEALRSREDAKLLGCSWLCYLSKSLRRGDDDDQWSPGSVFRDVLVKEMSDYSFNDFCNVLGWCLPSLEVLSHAQNVGKEFIYEGVPTIHELVAALSVEIGEDEGDWSQLVDWLIGVLFSSTNDIYFSSDPSYIGSKPITNDYVLGALIARTVDPTGTWEELWGAMSAVRFRLKHTPYERDGIPDDANRYLPMIGLAAFDWLSSPEEGRLSEAPLLWDALWKAVYGSWVNSVRGNNDIWAHYLHLILVRRSLLCGNDSEECADDLRYYLLKLGYAPRLVSVVACSLKSNVTVETMELLRADIEPSITAFLKSEEEETVKQIRYPALAEACRALYS